VELANSTTCFCVGHELFTAITVHTVVFWAHNRAMIIFFGKLWLIRAANALENVNKIACFHH
jgi:hypothetical protein